MSAWRPLSLLTVALGVGCNIIGDVNYGAKTNNMAYDAFDYSVDRQINSV